MLNISPHNSVSKHLPQGVWAGLEKDRLPAGQRMMQKWLLGLLFVFVVLLFMPWRQNVQAKGKLTTLDPSFRPQTIQATIAGRVERWYVQEGQLIKKGDTIVHLSEIKTEYFDPSLVNRTEGQVVAKAGALENYAQKADALAEQIAAMRQELQLKKEQLAAKIRQTELKITSLDAEVEQARIALDIAQRQFARTDTLFQQGIKSRTDWEDKRQKLQENQAKAVSATNKAQEARQELAVAQLELRNIVNEYNTKIAKTESDRFGTLSEQYAAQGDLFKMQVQAENYAQRQQFYYITAPQDCYVTQAVTTGIGETVKEGDPIVSIMPAGFQLAVELYIRPMDLPLVQVGNDVRFLFDGWPAIVFTGWPDLSFGTYSGRVAAIDNTTNKDGLYRILVAPNLDDRPWPEALRPGSAAKGIALLNQVPLWYELWRQLNGFPPDYYQGGTEEEKASKASSVDKMPKAPLKSVK